MATAGASGGTITAPIEQSGQLQVGAPFQQRKLFRGHHYRVVLHRTHHRTWLHRWWVKLKEALPVFLQFFSTSMSS
ncbi:hypothetical protein TYRP_006401 [Tyrophagus putrescentiae]|nr:hypothetical protein TYRP_006401 [Tyrophagus putrescentiae]